MGYQVIYADAAKFARFVKKLTAHQEALVAYSIEDHLAVFGLDLVESSHLKYLKDGLYEYRIGPTSTSMVKFLQTSRGISVPHSKILIRIFVAFRPGEVIVIASGYDKGQDSSRKRQQREIETALQILREL